MDGEMQRKGDVMCIWTLISDSILRTHRKRCQGATLRHVAMELMTHCCADAYVDDTDTLEQASENETMHTERHDSDRDPDGSEEEPIITDGVEEAVENLQHSADQWSKLVATIGHLMAFHKYCGQILAWIGVNGCLVPHTRDQINGDIHL